MSIEKVFFVFLFIKVMSGRLKGTVLSVSMLRFQYSLKFSFSSTLLLLLLFRSPVTDQIFLRYNKSYIRNDLFDNTYHHRQYSNKKHVYSQVYLPCTVAVNHFTLTSWCSELRQWVAQLLPTLRRKILRPPLGVQTEKLWKQLRKRNREDSRASSVGTETRIIEKSMFDFSVVNGSTI